jgi:hypothetical protein
MSWGKRTSVVAPARCLIKPGQAAGRMGASSIIGVWRVFLIAASLDV